jgi:hypothetical protein
VPRDRATPEQTADREKTPSKSGCGFAIGVPWLVTPGGMNRQPTGSDAKF